MVVKVQILISPKEYREYIEEYEDCNGIKPTIQEINDTYKERLCADFNDYIYYDNISVVIDKGNG